MVNTKRARIFISYKRDVDPDERVMQEVRQALRQQHEVFVDRDIGIGTHWAERIDLELQRCDFLIVFLSAESVQSDMVRSEIEKAYHLAQAQRGRPIILPVRLAYREKLPYSLHAYLNPLQHEVWKQHEDTPRLIDKLMQAISGEALPIGTMQAKSSPVQKSAMPPLPSSSAPLEMPEGTVDPQSTFYVKRPSTALPRPVGERYPSPTGRTARAAIGLGLIGVALIVLLEMSGDRRQPQPRIKNHLGIEFVLILAGEFLMGSEDRDPEANNDEKPQHQVPIRKWLYIGAHEVTQGQWEAVMGKENNLSRFTGDPRLPVENVPWKDVQEFLNRLNAREGKVLYRLPTEEEWEYAARAGSTTAYSFGDDATQLKEYAWYDQNAKNKTHPVGHREPNPWGLYDMHGNVWEWVDNEYRAYTSDTAVDPIGPVSALDRAGVSRGGSIFSQSHFCRSATRSKEKRDAQYKDLVGFRLVMEVQ